MDRAKDGMPSEWGMPDDEYDVLKTAMSSRDPKKIMGATRSDKRHFPRWASGLDRWSS